MKVIDPGHTYALDVLDGESSTEPEILRFVKREGEGYPGNVGHHPGTNMQEVIRALIDRVKYLNAQIPDWQRNRNVLDHLRQAIYYLEHRAAERHGRPPLEVWQMYSIEHYPTCAKCGHIGCEGVCHP